MPPARRTFAAGQEDMVVQITDDQSRTLINTRTNVAYHSGSGAVAETRSVYLHNSGVADRLHSGVPTSVLEIGLGTGMGMLLTVDAAMASQTVLEYAAVENRWLPDDVLRQLHLGDHLVDRSIADRFLAWRQTLAIPLPDGDFRWQAGPLQRVIVHHVDALDWVGDSNRLYDAIYFDPFAPAQNPELWSRGFLSRMDGVLRHGGRLVTYCVSRQIREVLSSIGFDVQRVRGPKGGKREVMIATKVKSNDEA